MVYIFTLLLPCLVTMVYSLNLICNHSNNSKSQNILSICLFLTSVSLFVLAYILSGMVNYGAYVILDIIDSIVTPILIPLMYLYFKSLIDETRLGWKMYILFVLPVVIGVGTLVSYLFMGWENALNYTLYHLTHQPMPSEYNSMSFKLHHFVSIDLYAWVTFFQTILISIYAVYNMIRYHARLRDFYSNLNNKSISVNNKLLVYLLLAALFSVILAITRESFWMNYYYLTMLYFVLMAAIYFGLCYYGTKTRHSVTCFADDIKQADINEKEFYDESLEF